MYRRTRVVGWAALSPPRKFFPVYSFSLYMQQYYHTHTHVYMDCISFSYIFKFCMRLFGCFKTRKIGETTTLRRVKSFSATIMSLHPCCPFFFLPSDFGEIMKFMARTGELWWWPFYFIISFWKWKTLRLLSFRVILLLLLLSKKDDRGHISPVTLLYLLVGPPATGKTEGVTVKSKQE